MTTLRFTLVADGASDEALIPILEWALQVNGLEGLPQGTYADLRRLPRPPRLLADRVARALDLYPCELLFVHRDAERLERIDRVREISTAMGSATLHSPNSPYVCVVPVRMQEAWLLSSELAIRTAAGNPRGVVALNLPGPSKVEDVPDPKFVLDAALRDASELRGRRLRGLDRRLPLLRRRVADLTGDFTALRDLSAFRALEADIRGYIATRVVRA